MKKSVTFRYAFRIPFGDAFLRMPKKDYTISGEYKGRKIAEWLDIKDRNDMSIAMYAPDPTAIHFCFRSKLDYLKFKILWKIVYGWRHK